MSVHLKFLSKYWGSSFFLPKNLLGSFIGKAQVPLVCCPNHAPYSEGRRIGSVDSYFSTYSRLNVHLIL